MLKYNRKIVMQALGQMKQIFTAKEFRKKVVVLGEPLPPKAEYEILRSLHSKRHIARIDRFHFKKLAPTYYNPVEHFEDLIERCRSEQKIRTWEAQIDGAFLGIPENLDLPEWKEEILSLLMFRIKEIIQSIQYLMTWQHTVPSYYDSYLRQTILELIPHYLERSRGEEGDGFNDKDLIELTRRMIATLPPDQIPGSEMLNHLDKIEEWYHLPYGKNPEPTKISSLFGIMMVPHRQSLPEENVEEKDVVKDLIDGLNSGRSDYSLLFDLTHNEDIAVREVFKKYEGYFPAKRIKRVKEMYEKYQRGSIILRRLYNIALCHTTLQKLSDNSVKEGQFIAADPLLLTHLHGHAFTRKQLSMDLFPEYYRKQSDEPYYKIKRRPFYEKLLSESIDEITAVIKQCQGPNQAVSAVIFSSELCMTNTPLYRPAELNIADIINNYTGFRITEKELSKSIAVGKEEAGKIIKEGMKKLQDSKGKA